MGRLDPRTRMFLGLSAITWVICTRSASLSLLQSALFLTLVLLLRCSRAFLRTIGSLLPMVALVGVITGLSIGLDEALVTTVRFFNLLTMSLLLFTSVSPEEMAAGLLAIRMPFELVFVFVTAFRYVPHIMRRAKRIMDAQKMRGIDLRPRLRAVPNMVALLVPLLVQSFLLSEDLAMAMECRGFGRKGRTRRRELRFGPWDYVVWIAIFVSIAVTLWGKSSTLPPNPW